MMGLAGSSPSSPPTSVRGTRLLGQDVKVSFDGFPAQVIAAAESGQEQKIDLVVPVALANQTQAQMQVIVNGVASLAYPVTLAPAAPIIRSPWSSHMMW